MKFKINLKYFLLNGQCSCPPDAIYIQPMMYMAYEIANYFFPCHFAHDSAIFALKFKDEFFLLDESLRK